MNTFGASNNRILLLILRMPNIDLQLHTHLMATQTMRIFIFVSLKLT